MLNEPKKIILRNKDIVCLYKYVNLEIQYKRNRIIERFYLLENTFIETLIGKDCIDKLTNPPKDEFSFPIICEISTKHDNAISWSRPYRSYHDKQKILKLMNEYESKGYIEPSTSRYLNPVILREKKSGKIRFA